MPLRFVLAILLAFASLGAPAADKDVDRARELLDGYYGGQQRKLEEARDLLQKAVVAEPRNAEVYVQAARLAVMSGYIVGNVFQGGTIEVYGELLDKALALDPRNGKAHILKAEYFDQLDQFEKEKAELDRAAQLSPGDPWLYVGFDRYFTRQARQKEAEASRAKVIERGPGRTASERKAYVKALEKEAWGMHFWSKQGDVMQWVQMIRRERDPADAWVLGNMAILFNLYGRYDDAIDLAREARQVMDYGVARSALGTALYGKAARMVAAGQQKTADSLIAEASALGVSRERILHGYPLQGPQGEEVKKLRPILERIVR